jgi:ankyrin repeat protein
MDPAKRPTFDHICDLFALEILTWPQAPPGGTRDMCRRVSKRDGGWVWNDRKYGRSVANSAAKERKPDSDERMFRAAQAGDIQQFAKYFTFTSEMDINLRNEQGLTPLHVAIVSGQALMITFLLAIDGIDANARTPQGDTPLTLATRAKQLGAMQALVACEHVDVDAVNQEGYCALHIAICYKSRDLLHVLFKRGVDLMNKDASGNTPKMIATEVGFTELAAKLPG